MQKSTAALWGIEFKTDLTVATSTPIPVAFMLEATWPGTARWLGLMWRKHLTKVELEAVDLETWPELRDIGPFMHGLFLEAWNNDEHAAGALARKYSNRGALRFVPEPAGVELGAFERLVTPPRLLKDLLKLGARLTPALTADVLRPAFGAKKAAAPKLDDVGYLNEAA